ncbi:MAG: hypothetical protein Q8R40_05855 [bacterium]|nr:hypothetical protein [bacterium]
MRTFPCHHIQEFKIFKKLNSPSKIQDFLDAMPINFEPHGDTCRSPLMALRYNSAHCMEGAQLAAAMFWYHNEKPLLVDLKTTDNDMSHVVTLFKRQGRWGAVSKTNHAVLRYRDPIYKTVRELVMSYFNEYFLDNGKKTLRSYSAPFSLLTHNPRWLTHTENSWDIAEQLDTSPHITILEKSMIRNLRAAHSLEIQAGKLTEWKKEG